MTSILIIEDEEPIRRVLKKILLEEDESYNIYEAKNGKEGLEIIKSNNKLDIVLCDIKMPLVDGLEVLNKSKNIKPNLPFIMLTGHGNINTAVDAMKTGAFDFISKPPDLNRLITSVRNAIENNKLKSENKKLKKRVHKSYEIIGNSKVINSVKEMISKVSNTDARVLITGESGTGKELVAHQIHLQSNRNKEALVEVNCAAIPSELIESELFGHIKGSFTSAIKDRRGKFEVANNGTIFLDEVADMSLKAQAKVLRALEEKKIQRVGSDKNIKVNVRVIAATNKDLKKEISNGNFREDLYHRLAVILINVPRLDERKEDISLLSNHFVKNLSLEQGTELKIISEKAISLLKDYNWTGNIRELRNVIERLIILGDNPISIDDIKKYASK
tara:strand:+ start:1077 stop:2243 length:1167 start_codon:yes stop_codon:yes gene_type:complete